MGRRSESWRSLVSILDPEKLAKVYTHRIHSEHAQFHLYAPCLWNLDHSPVSHKQLSNLVVTPPAMSTVPQGHHRKSGANNAEAGTPLAGWSTMQQNLCRCYNGELPPIAFRIWVCEYSPWLSLALRITQSRSKVDDRRSYSTTSLPKHTSQRVSTGVVPSTYWLVSRPMNGIQSSAYFSGTRLCS